MKRMFLKLHKKDSGEIMVESAIIIPLTLMILLAILSLGFFYYQQSMMATVADEIAAKVGAGYKFSSIDQPLNDYIITEEALTDTKMYRTTFSFQKISQINKERAEEYLPSRVNLTSLGINGDSVAVDDFRVIMDNAGRAHVEVDISMRSNFLFSEVLVFFGIFDATPTIRASGRAECLDITAYASQVKYLEYLSSKDGGNIESIINSARSIMDSVKSIADKFN